MRPRLKAEGLHQEIGELTRQYLEGGGLIAKVKNRRLTMECGHCGRKQVYAARTVVAWGSPPCSRCGARMRAG
jgi:hypothetical protein